MAENQEILTKSFDLIGESINRMWLLWQSSLSSFAKMQEQMENATRNQLDQNKAAREEWIKLMEELGRQTQQNQEQFQKMLQDAVQTSYQYLNPPR